MPAPTNSVTATYGALTSANWNWNVDVQVITLKLYYLHVSMCLLGLFFFTVSVVWQNYFYDSVLSATENALGCKQGWLICSLPKKLYVQLYLKMTVEFLLQVLMGYSRLQRLHICNSVHQLCLGQSFKTESCV
jgi:hypothetical protein